MPGMDWDLAARYFAAAGGDIGAGRPIGQEVNKVTDDAVTMRALWKMNLEGKQPGKSIDPTVAPAVAGEEGLLKNYLKDKYVSGETMSGDAMDLASTYLGTNEPGGSKHISEFLELAKGGKLSDGQKMTIDGKQTIVTTPNMAPSDSAMSNQLAGNEMPNIGGMDPDLYMKALAYKSGREESSRDFEQKRKVFEQKKVTDLATMEYQRTLGKESKGRAETMERRGEPFINVAGRPLNIEQFRSLTPDDRKYAIHTMAAEASGETPMAQIEFEALGDKTKLPTTAMATAIADYVTEHKAFPPPAQLKEWTEMFRASTGEKTPAPMTWTTATKELTKRFRFSELDKWEGNNQAIHGIAQRILDRLRKEDIHPMTAVDMAETEARARVSEAEEVYNEQMENVRNDEELESEDERKAAVDSINRQFKKKYGFTPDVDYGSDIKPKPWYKKIL